MDRMAVMEVLLKILQKGDIDAYADLSMNDLSEVIVVSLNDRIYHIKMIDMTKQYKED